MLWPDCVTVLSHCSSNDSEVFQAIRQYSAINSYSIHLLGTTTVAMKWKLSFTWRNTATLAQIWDELLAIAGLRTLNGAYFVLSSAKFTSNLPKFTLKSPTLSATVTLCNCNEEIGSDNRILKASLGFYVRRSCLSRRGIAVVLYVGLCSCKRHNSTISQEKSTVLVMFTK